MSRTVPGCRPYRFTPTCVGTSIAQVARRHGRRFTPTCVGTIAAAAEALRSVCGFTPTCVGTMSCASCGRAAAVRFTPTCVGTMSRTCRRGHGERGSPPRAWGRCVIRAIGRRAARFTPTCVGTMRASRSCDGLPHPVHPHVRGDDDVGCVQRSSRRRFTPTCVGTSAVAPLHGRLERFTPTCVGTSTDA